MVQQVTEGVSVTVETFYQPAQSNPLSSEYLFAYRITIENLGSVPIKLLRRHWHIMDSNGSYREVEGDGVVGQQPVIEPGANYQYVSAANLRSEMGKMYGTYQMENLYNKRLSLLHNLNLHQNIFPFKAHLSEGSTVYDTCKAKSNARKSFSSPSSFQNASPPTTFIAASPIASICIFSTKKQHSIMVPKDRQALTR